MEVGATAQQCHLRSVAVRQLVCRGQGGVSDLWDPHILEHLRTVRVGGGFLHYEVHVHVQV